MLRHCVLSGGENDQSEEKVITVVYILILSPCAEKVYKIITYFTMISGYVVHNADELEKIMAVGNKNRHIGATAMNIESSRSHAIFSITVENSKKGADNKMHVKMGKLHLVDLAVS